MNTKDMSVSDGIKELKECRNELQRLITMQKEKFTVLVPVEVKTVAEYSKTNSETILFSEIEIKIQHTKLRIMNLRYSLDKTAHETLLKCNGQEITLAFLRLMVEEARADVDRIQNMVKSDTLFSVRHRARLTTDDKEHEVAQLTDQQLEDLIKVKIKIKNDFDKLLEKTNVNTSLVLSDLDLTL